METPPTSSNSKCGSWVDLSKEFSGVFSLPQSPRRTTPVPGLPFGHDPEYMSMLSEAQREFSARSSARVSPMSSALMSLSSTRKNTPTPSPKSPPNSPNNEVAGYNEELRGIYVNSIKDMDHASAVADFMWDWSSRPNMMPPKDWKLQGQSSRGSSAIISLKKKDDESGMSRSVVYTLVFTNIISLIIGAGIGIWMFRRSSCDKIISVSLE